MKAETALAHPHSGVRGPCLRPRVYTKGRLRAPCFDPTTREAQGATRIQRQDLIGSKGERLLDVVAREKKGVRHKKAGRLQPRSAGMVTQTLPSGRMSRDKSGAWDIDGRWVP